MSEPVVILVHGAWHGGWCWAALQAELDRRGVPSLAPDLPGRGSSREPLGDLYADADSVARLIERLDRPTVLVGHSYGGMVITQAAGACPQVAELIYVAALLPRQGDSVMGLLQGFEPRRVALGLATRPGPTEDTTSVDPELAAGAFYQQAPPEVAAAAAARLCPHAAASFTQPVTTAPSSATPSTYVLCQHDEAVHPDHQAVMARRATEVVTWDADHSPFLTRPDDLAELIHAAWRRTVRMNP